MTMFTHVHLDHVVLRAVDVPAMLAFYANVLGAEIERELDIGLIQLRLGDILIDIVPCDGELGRKGGGPPPAPDATDGPGRNLDHFCLRVEPFDDATIHAHLARCGVVGSATTELYGAEGYGPSIYLHDPDGNTVELKGPATRSGREPV
jgi:glyoxylase I family protein